MNALQQAIKELDAAKHLMLAAVEHIPASDQDEILDDALDCAIVSDYLKSLVAHSVPVCLTPAEILAGYPAIADSILDTSLQILRETMQ